MSKLTFIHSLTARSYVVDFFIVAPNYTEM